MRRGSRALKAVTSVPGSESVADPAGIAARLTTCSALSDTLLPWNQRHPPDAQSQMYLLMQRCRSNKAAPESS